MALFCVISAKSGSFRAHSVKVHVRYLISWWVLVFQTCNSIVSAPIIHQFFIPLFHRSLASYVAGASRTPFINIESVFGRLVHTTFAIFCRPSVRLSVRLVHPTQPVEIFGNISTAFGTLAIRWYSRKILRRSSQGNPSDGGVKHNRGSQI